MIEKKYTKFPEFSNKGTNVQFDQHEQQTILGSKNWYSYSFLDFGNLDTINNLAYPVFSSGIVVNYNQPPASWNAIKKEGYHYSNFTRNYEMPVGPAIDSEFNTFVFDQDTLMYLNDQRIGVYGTYIAVSSIESFRSGFFEITLKTDKENCIIASGTKEIKVNTSMALMESSILEGIEPKENSSIDGSLNAYSSPASMQDDPYFELGKPDTGLVTVEIGIKDGKLYLDYKDLYKKENCFTFIGNENISDNEWHHIVVNFGRPGTIKEHGKKFNKKFIEFWLDGDLDKRFTDIVNEKQIFYPALVWLNGNPVELYKNFIKDKTGYQTYDGFYVNPDGWTDDGYRGLEEFSRTALIDSLYLEESTKKLFRGSIENVTHGLNIPLSRYEIAERNALFRRQEKRFAKTIDLIAEIVEPKITTNSKKALKLFWNTLVDNGTFGLQLDNKYQVESYSVTHKLKNSPSDVFNLNKNKNKSITISENVRAAFKDNILILGPGKITMGNTGTSYYTPVAPFGSGAYQDDPRDNEILDGIVNISKDNRYSYTSGTRYKGPISNLTFSGLKLNSGDRILLTNQIDDSENGIWVFNGLDKYMTRPVDSIPKDTSIPYVVYVEEGEYADTYWINKTPSKTLAAKQEWNEYNFMFKEYIDSNPIFGLPWTDEKGEERFIDLEQDIDIEKYDLIVFMNYPETNEQVFDNFQTDDGVSLFRKYENFVKSIKNVVANGANLFVSSPKLAEDLGIVKTFTAVDQVLQDADLQSANISPFEINEPAERYFDTHRINRYQIVTEVSGLTDKETYVLTDFVNYNPANIYEYEQYHAKYGYRQFGLQEGNEIMIPGLALRAITENQNIPGIKNNQRGAKPIIAVKPEDVVAGTVVTQLQNTYYDGDTVVSNPYDDYATTIILSEGDLLDGQPIAGKIFVNCVEDAYTFSREEYNKAVIQVLPENDPNETTATRQWQYSTTRLNRLPKRVNVSGVTEFGQTVSTNGGGGALIQAPTNSSNGIIRPDTDKGNKDYESDLYPQESEEKYELQEIPVLSMTWLGLEWLSE